MTDVSFTITERPAEKDVAITVRGLCGNTPRHCTKYFTEERLMRVGIEEAQEMVLNEFVFNVLNYNGVPNELFSHRGSRFYRVSRG
jgi:sarcosine oxidase delta subunit